MLLFIRIVLLIALHYNRLELLEHVEPGHEVLDVEEGVHLFEVFESLIELHGLGGGVEP